MAFLRVSDTRLEYEWHGPRPPTPTIVFLHEGLGCVEMWRDFPNLVSTATGLGALVYSRAGYGNSDPIQLPRSISFMHEEATNVLPRILDIFQISEAILLGHSDGGSIALIYAASGQADMVSGLVLEAPHVFVEDISIRSISAAAESYAEGTLRRGLERYHGANTECAFRGWNEAWLNPAFRSWNIESCLPRITVPSLVIQGEDDEYGTLRQVEAIQRGIGGQVETLIIPGCGHSPHRDQPELVINSIRKFIGDRIRRE